MVAFLHRFTDTSMDMIYISRCFPFTYLH